MRILGVSGSLRRGSVNASILRAAAKVAPSGVDLVAYERLGELPHFNPDLDGEDAVAPGAVAEFRAQLNDAAAILLCSPEYAHGAPGVLKNALDWLVSVVPLIGKPVAVIVASPSGGEHAQSQLVHTLMVMSWRVIEPANLRFALGRAQLDAHGELVDENVLAELRRAIAALSAAAH
jgi:NAD(P)H-dependent FMN reductase